MPEQKKPVPLVNDGLSPSDVDFIPPLVHSLVTLLRLRGKSVSTAFLMAGLAGTGRVSPGACLHAAKRAGLEGKIVYRKSLQDISTLVLPCILLLSRDRSCVLTSLDDGKAERTLGIGFLRTLFSDEVAKILLVKAFFIDAADEAERITRGFKINRCGAGLQQSAVIHRLMVVSVV